MIFKPKNFLIVIVDEFQLIRKYNFQALSSKNFRTLYAIRNSEDDFLKCVWNGSGLQEEAFVDFLLLKVHEDRTIEVLKFIFFAFC